MSDQTNPPVGKSGPPWMTVRDYFAGQVVMGMMAANPPAPSNMNPDNVDQIMAREAYRLADAMLAERDKC